MSFNVLPEACKECVMYVMFTIGTFSVYVACEQDTYFSTELRLWKETKKSLLCTVISPQQYNASHPCPHAETLDCSSSLDIFHWHHVSISCMRAIWFPPYFPLSTDCPPCVVHLCVQCQATSHWNASYSGDDIHIVSARNCIHNGWWSNLINLIQIHSVLFQVFRCLQHQTDFPLCLSAPVPDWDPDQHIRSWEDGVSYLKFLYILDSAPTCARLTVEFFCVLCVLSESCKLQAQILSSSRVSWERIRERITERIWERQSERDSHRLKLKRGGGIRNGDKRMFLRKEEFSPQLHQTPGEKC